MCAKLDVMGAKRLTGLLAAAGLLAGAAALAQAAPAALPEADTACASCHADAIGVAGYLASVHSSNGCASCHADVDLAQHPGNVAALKASERPAAAASRACATCHAEAEAQHGKWMPNAATHLKVVECAACHAPGATRRVELRLHDAARNEFTVKAEALPAVKIVDAVALRHLVQRSGGASAVMVVGRIDVPDASDAHRLAHKSSAVRECATCHRKGSDTFGRVALSVIGPDGQRVAYDVDASVLNEPRSIDALRGFYAMGGTRIGALDVLLGLAVLGGITAPLGHAVARRLLRGKEGGS